MTREELDEIVKERGTTLRFIDLEGGGKYLLPCEIGGYPALSEIEIVDWVKNYTRVRCMLDAHVFFGGTPYEKVIVVASQNYKEPDPDSELGKIRAKAKREFDEGVNNFMSMRDSSNYRFDQTEKGRDACG